jgi:hypothetical protein
LGAVPRCDATLDVQGWCVLTAGLEFRFQAQPDMLKVRIIPCLDVKDGRVVKGVNFV